ncbi:hypothetical protein P7M07_23195, partial [Vibrio parahaemolyticus]|nr:hypothetical protein [Vibrio parahaemolyticus]
EETKQILRMLEKDDFIDDPGLKNDTRNMPVQLPLAHSGSTSVTGGGEEVFFFLLYYFHNHRCAC